MGWFFDRADLTRHEGYAIGLVREPIGIFRALSVETDRGRDRTAPLEYVQVGCDCGWRSPYLYAPSGTTWFPSVVHFGEHNLRAEERARLIWRAHVEQVLLEAGQHPSAIRPSAAEWNRRHRPGTSVWHFPPMRASLDTMALLDNGRLEWTASEARHDRRGDAVVDLEGPIVVGASEAARTVFLHEIVAAPAAEPAP